MSKELPYFKFIATEWLTGDIALETLEAQGLFINICALYWKKLGVLEISEIEKRFKKRTLISVLKNRYFSVLENGKLCIKFLDEQLSDRKDLSKQNSENIKKRWADKNVIRNDTTVYDRNTKRYNIEKEEEKEKNKEEEGYKAPAKVFVTDEVIKNTLEFHKGMIQGQATKHKLTYDQAHDLIKGFLEEQRDIGYEYDDMNDLRKHILNWLRKHMETEKKNTDRFGQKHTSNEHVKITKL